ncbi:MAG: hypothetical protein ACE5JM_05250 [Armatimonadota bacterium]
MAVDPGVRTGVPSLLSPWPFFEKRQTAAGIVARRDLFGTPTKGDVAVADRLARRVWRKQRKDGSWGGSIYKTAMALEELVDLRVDPERRGVKKAVDWMLSQQDLARLFADHLFSFPPITSGLPEKEMRLPGAQRIRNKECMIRVAALALLRACLRLGLEKEQRVQHYLLLATRVLSAPEHAECTDCRQSILLALSYHPVIKNAGPVMATLNWFGMLQDGGGEWRGCDFYHTLYTIGHFPIPSTRLQFRAAVPVLAERQNKDGSWGRGAYQEDRTFAATYAMAAFGLLPGSSAPSG